jgi:DNA polymerase V
MKVMVVFALIDGNNFYASCERVFNPRLQTVPIIVLSNNDGCIIARSNEAKAVGIKMGAPFHEMKALVEKHGVRAFSSNYTLYGDMSARMMQTLSEFSPDTEVYSIDECFLGMDGFQHFNLVEYGQTIRETVKRNVGIPCSVGIAPTKTLAKVANRFAKRNLKLNGVMVISEDQTRRLVLENTEIGDVWGIGRQYGQKLKQLGLSNAFQLSTMSPAWGKANLSGVVGERLIHELNGVSCINLEMVQDPKKNIAATRAFGKVVTEKKEIGEALSFHISRAAEKLRAQNSVANIVTFFLHSNPFNKSFPFVQIYNSIKLPVATSDTRKFNDPVQTMLTKLFRPNVRYHKCGVMLQGIMNASQIQTDFFHEPDSDKAIQLMKSLDMINHRFGRGTLNLGSTGFGSSWKTQANRKSAHFTTDWNELLIVKA